jgi:hypothetical protein
MTDYEPVYAAIRRNLIKFGYTPNQVPIETVRETHAGTAERRRDPKRCHRSIRRRAA